MTGLRCCPLCGTPRAPDTITGRVPRHGQPDDIFARLDRMGALAVWYGDEAADQLGGAAAVPLTQGHDDPATRQTTELRREKVIALDPRSPFTAYIQVADVLLGLIRDGEVHGKAPSAREVASDFAVSTSTAAKALKWLARFGVLEPLPGRRGYQVIDQWRHS